VLVLLFASMAGYAFAKKKFLGREVIFWVFIAMLMIPYQLTIIPQYLIVGQIGGRACQMVCVSRTERNGTIMTMTNEKQQHDDGPSGQDLVEQLKASGQLDALFEQIDAGQVELTGDGGVVPALGKAALERGLPAELTRHPGHEKGAGR